MSVRIAGVLSVALALLLTLGLAKSRPTADTSGMSRAGSVSTADAENAAARAAGRRALALVDVPEGLDHELEFRARHAGDPRAAIDRDARVIRVYVTQTDSLHRIAHDIAHEYGHAYDDMVLDDGDRRAWLELRGAAGAAWWPGGAWSDYATGAGDFAEVFAACRAASPEFRSRLAPRPAEPCSMLPGWAGRA